MALPKLETPTYTTIIPSTGDQVEYRPFLVKEEKILLLAQESKSSSEITRAMKKILHACLFEKVDVGLFKPYDMEYIFLQLRAKSVGETVEVEYKCEHCDHPNQLTINLDDVKIVKPEKEVSNKIKLNDKVGMTLKHINVNDLLSPALQKANIADVGVVESLSLMIETIYDENEVYDVKETSKKELHEFIESLPHTALEKVQEFATAIPKLRYETTFKCVNCGKENNIVIEGLEGFFI
tara:strand:+ start:960 stop:1673 length:714 start_codon:yes stop_codon:yes gene_type:complete